MHAAPPSPDAASPIMAAIAAGQPVGCTQTGRCGELQQQFAATYATRTGTCKTVDDCGEFETLGLTGSTGATDKAHARALQVIAAEFDGMHCPAADETGPAPTLVCRGGTCALDYR